MLFPLLAVYAFIHNDLKTLLPLVAAFVLQKYTHTNKQAYYPVLKESASVQPVSASQWDNPYENPLVGMPANKLMDLKTQSDTDVLTTLYAMDKKRMSTDVREVDQFGQHFMQMPDPSLMNFRGVVFDRNSNNPEEMLPNQGLVLERDFGGASASNDRGF